MKKTIVSIIVLLISTSGILAQETAVYEGSAFFPKKDDFGASILMDGLIDNINLQSNTNDYGQNILFAKYYLEDDLVLRAGFGLSLNNFKRETADSSGAFLREVDSVISNYNINVSFGAEKHLSNTKRLDPFVFGQIDLTFIGKTNTESETRLISSVGTNRTERTIKRDGGLAFGLQAGGGFNYFLSEKFSIGTEIALQIQYVKQGGTVSDNTITTDVNGISVSDFESREDLTKQTDINVSPNASINLSFFF